MLVLSLLVFTPGVRVGPAAETFLRHLARERACRFIPRASERHLVCHGISLQVSVYAMKWRVGRASAAALRAYPSFFVPVLPNSIGQHTTPPGSGDLTLAARASRQHSTSTPRHWCVELRGPGKGQTLTQRLAWMPSSLTANYRLARSECQEPLVSGMQGNLLGMS